MALTLALIATTFPFWLVALPPATDLPQHLSQIYLLEQTLAAARTDLVVTPWFYPNTLIYWLMYGFWKITDPISAGKLTMSSLAGFWVIATWALCRLHRRPLENWLIAIPLVFNFLFNWGLLNFLIGWPMFCLFITIVGNQKLRFRSVWIVIVAFLLYYAHALWFAMANVWLTTQIMEHRGKERLKVAWPLLPPWILALTWYPQLAMNRQSSGVETGLIWGAMPHERLAPTYFTNSALGSMHAEIEFFFSMLLLAWITCIIFTRKKELEQTTDKPLLVAACLMLLAYWALPSVYMNTIFFNQRWLVFGLILLLIALPAPRLPRLYQMTIGVSCILAFTVVTVKQWKEWEVEQLEGLQEALALVSKGERLIGLNLIDGSTFVKGRPGLQLFSYAQALRGAELHFSFTEHYSGAVQYRSRPPLNPYKQTVWSPYRATAQQIRDFDKVLINGDERLHAFVSKQLNLIQIDETQASWRLYRTAP